MKAHLAFLCNGRCQWCKNYWNCSKTKRLLAKIWGGAKIGDGKTDEEHSPAAGR